MGPRVDERCRHRRIWHSRKALDKNHAGAEKTADIRERNSYTSASGNDSRRPVLTDHTNRQEGVADEIPQVAICRGIGERHFLSLKKRNSVSRPESHPMARLARPSVPEL